MFEKEVATNAATAAATLSSVMLSFFGVDHQSLFFGFMGAFFTYALRETSGHSRIKSLILVFASAFIGGVFGMAFGSHENPPAPLSLFLCAVGGSGMAAILTTSRKAAIEMVKRVLGGSQ